jgi:LacI family transcriptional regulator, repressor for deo operon, udp, cdd, tsx, nupC, and nupG
MAIGALFELNNQRINVPDDISVVGFDNIPYSAFTSPPLTTFDQPKRMIGAEAAQMLINILNKPATGQDQEPVTHIMRGHLLVRGSTKEPKTRSS